MSDDKVGNFLMKYEWFFDYLFFFAFPVILFGFNMQYGLICAICLIGLAIIRLGNLFRDFSTWAKFYQIFKEMK